MNRLGLFILLMILHNYIDLGAFCHIDPVSVNGQVVPGFGCADVCEGTDVHISFHINCNPSACPPGGPTIKLTRSTDDLTLFALESEGFDLPNVSLSDTATYIMTFVVDNPAGNCFGPALPFALNVNPKPAFTVTIKQQPGCGLSNGIIEVNSNIFLKFCINGGDCSLETSHHQFENLAAGTYIISTEDPVTHCINEQTVELNTIEDFPIQVTVCRDVPVTLTAPFFADATYEWTANGAILPDTDNDIEVTPLVPTTYTVTISQNNGACQNSNSVRLVPVDCPQVDGPAVCISKCGPDKVHHDEKFKYVLKVTNGGTSDATGLKIVDTLPPCVEFLGFESADFELFSQSEANNTITFKQKEDHPIAPCTLSKIKLRVKAHCLQGTITNKACIEGTDRCAEFETLVVA